MSSEKLTLTQKKIIGFVKKHYSINSPFLKKNYFAFYENSPGVLKVKETIFKKWDFRFFLRNFIESVKNNNVSIIDNKKKIKKNYKNLIITWGTRNSFSTNGVYFDKYFSYKSKDFKNTFWIVILPSEINIKKLNDNLSILYLKNKNKFKETFTIIINLFLKFTGLKNFKDKDYFISNSINNYINSNDNLKNLKNLIMPYEGQAFQKNIFYNQKKRNKRINTFGFDHSAPHSIATQLFYTKGSPDKLIVTGKNTKKAYSQFYSWPKSKIIETYPNRYKKFKKSNFFNKMFLPHDFENAKLIQDTFNSFLDSNKEFALDKIEILVHPVKKNVLKHLTLRDNLKKILNIYKKKNKKKLKKEITIVVGFTSAALVALEYKNTVLHICPNPEIETYLSYFWNDIKVTKINDFSYIYNLRTNGKYLNFNQNDKIKRILHE